MVRVYDNGLWDVLRTLGGVAGAWPASGSAEGTLEGEEARTITGQKVHIRVSPLTERVDPAAVAVSPRVAPPLPYYWSSSGYGFAPSIPQ